MIVQLVVFFNIYIFLKISTTSQSVLFLLFISLQAITYFFSFLRMFLLYSRVVQRKYKKIYA